MATLLLKNAALLATMDDADTRYADGGIFVDGNEIRQIGPSANLPASADTVIDARNMVVLPGLVNTHHHFYQTLTRNIPRVQEAELFPWLVHLYEVWRHLTPEGLYWATQLALGELLLTGCTTTTDHFYLNVDGVGFGLINQPDLIL